MLPIWCALGHGGKWRIDPDLGRQVPGRTRGRQDAGRGVFELPICDSPLAYPNLFGVACSQAFAPFRHLGQRFLYKWCGLRDQKLQLRVDPPSESR
ncbi:MAG: hypothetical protein H7306_14670 [Bacteriovorax sp.]|nr:hypothetical protein [Rhizobacter sp.]